MGQKLAWQGEKSTYLENFRRNMHIVDNFAKKLLSLGGRGARCHYLFEKNIKFQHSDRRNFLILSDGTETT